MPPHQRAELPDFLEAVLEGDDLLGKPPCRQGPLREEERLVDVEGLREVVVRATLHRLNGGLHRAVGRHDHDLSIGALLANLAQQREPVDAGHADVEEDEIEGLRLRLEEGRRAILHADDLVAGPAKSLLEHPAEPVFVVRDEDAALGHGRHSTLRPYLAMGRKQENAVPCPGSLTTWIAPLCSSTMR